MPDRRPKVLLHCQYVYGIGHYVRAVELARGLAGSFDVAIVSGGEPVPNYDLPPGVHCVQLPAIYKEEHLPHLSSVDPNFRLVDCFASRAAQLERLADQFAPDILITEHFPFGLLFEAEVTSLIGHVKRANPRAKIVCSVRDVIESEAGGPQDLRTCALLNRLFDMVLVHSDPRVIPLSTSFSQLNRIEIPVHHTGYVVQPPPQPYPAASGTPQLLVSIGGGRMGEELLYAALAAQPLLAEYWPHRMALFAGAHQPDVYELQARVAAGKHSHVTLHGFSREAHRQALARASALICLGGYNTLVEAVASRLPTLIYRRKFHGQNTEQDLRSALFARAGLVQTLQPYELSPERLAARVVGLVMARVRRGAVELQTNGAAEAQRLLSALVTVYRF